MLCKKSYVFSLNELSYLEYDYDDIEYPVPFNVLVSNVSTHYVDYGIRYKSLPYLLTGDIPTFHLQTSDVLMMTGASDNHGYGSFNCLYSMVLADPYASYLYIDLGLSPELKEKLFAHFETIHEIQRKMRSTGFIGYRKFNWSSFPQWMNLFENKDQRGGYTWKVVSYMDALFAWQAITFWIDGGSLIRDGISREVTNARLEGIYSPVSGGGAEKWVHAKTVDFLLTNHLIDSFDKKGRMGCGGHLITDWSNKTVLNKVIIPYKECAYTQKCISPRGSNMTNHRQDQAVLSAFLNNLGLEKSMNSKYQALPALRQERGNNEKFCKLILNNYLLSIQNTYQIKIDNRYYKTSNITYTTINYKFVSFLKIIFETNYLLHFFVLNSEIDIYNF